jgi:hypothetical protein
MRARRLGVVVGCIASLLVVAAPANAGPEEDLLAGTSTGPAPVTPPPEPEKSCSECLRGVGALALGLEPGLMFRSGPHAGDAGFALGASLSVAGFVQSKRFIYQLALDESAAVGWAGLQYVGDTLLAIGVRGITSQKRVVDQGLFLRTGISSVYLANNVALARILDFPYGELGWSLVTDHVGFQVYARFGAAVVGDFSAGRRFEDRDARRQIDPAFEGGFGATLGLGERVVLDGRYIEVWPDDGRSTIRYATGRACLTIAVVGDVKIPIGTCARAVLVDTDVRELRDGPPGADPWSRWNVGFVGLTLGIGGGFTGTAERHHGG